MRVLQLVGVADDDEIRVVQTYAENGQPLFFIDGSLPLAGYVEGARSQIFICGGGETKRAKIVRPDVVINGICDPDSHTKSLKDAEAVIASLNVPVVNHPELIERTARDKVAKLLQGIDGVVVPKVRRIRPKSIREAKEVAEESGFGYPLLFRPAGGQGGGGLIRIEEAAEFEKLERFALDGRDYYLIEFIDFASADGLYRKYRFFVIDRKVYPGHLIVSDEWQIHVDDSQKRFQREEKTFLSDWKRETIPLFEEIARRLELDFFGVDCAFDRKGRMLLFEVNSCMDIFSGEKASSYYHPKYRKKLTEAITKMVRNKMETERPRS